MSISAVIVTKNSDTYLDRVLKSVRTFDEVLVCDMGSTDDTLKIATDNGARVIKFDHKKDATHAEARNFAIKSARSRWVLYLEPDEYITKDMPQLLYSYIHDIDNNIRGFYIPRKTYFLNRFNAIAYPDYHLRFFNKEVTFWDDVESHEPKVDGNIKKISASDHKYAIHQIPQTLSSIINSVNRETDNVARTNARKTSVLKLFAQPTLTFLNCYFMKGGFVYGVAGYLSSCKEAIKKYYTLAKAHENAITESNED